MIVPLIVVLAIADDVHIMQHWDEERRHRRRRAGVQEHGRAPGGAAARRQRHHRARHAVARDQRRRRGAVVRRRLGDRHHGRLRDLAGRHADASQPGEAGDRHAAARALPAAARCGGSPPGRPRIRAACSSSVSRSGRCRRSGSFAFASIPTTSTSSAARHPLGAVGGGHRHEARRRLQLPDHAGGAARLAEDAGRPPADGSAAEPSCGSARTCRKVTSVADYVKRIHRELNDGRPDADVIPDDAGDDRAGAVRVHARRRRAARARADRRQRLLARADRRSSCGR